MSFFRVNKKWLALGIVLFVLLGVSFIMHLSQEQQQAISVSGGLGSPMDEIIVDRVEGRYALCEDLSGQMQRIELSKLPKGIKEGDLLKFTQEGYKVDNNSRKSSVRNIGKQVDQLWE